MAWWYFRQNKSGGFFLDGLAGVYVEAANAEEANERAQTVEIYFDGVDAGYDCECCGDRWSRVDESEAVPDDEVILRVGDGTLSTPLFGTRIGKLPLGATWIKFNKKDATT